MTDPKPAPDAPDDEQPEPADDVVDEPAEDDASADHQTPTEGEGQ
jgi:hypothetical protein